MTDELTVERLDRIAVGLEELLRRRLHGKRAVWRRDHAFAAGGHGWRHEPVAEDELDALEAKLGVALPFEFRAFMLRFGARLAPGYEVYGPGDVLSATENFFDGPDGLGPVKRPFRFTTGRDIEPDEDPFPEGSIVITEGGCDFFTVMAVTGPLAGTVWDNDYGPSRPYGFWPARVYIWPIPHERPVQPVSFLQWVQTWVDDALVKTTPPDHATTRWLRTLLQGRA